MHGTSVTAGRTTADTEGDVAVLLIGMRINRFRAVRHWLPVFLAMPRMLRELAADPDSGLLGHVLLMGSPRVLYLVQYWESGEKLRAYAHAPGLTHHPAWTDFNRRRRQAAGRGHVGLWHETYLVPEGSHESVYVDMPPFGLAAAHGQVPVERRGRSAAERLAHRAPRRTAPGAGASPAES
ncbi:DUF4188 domain-containing protein [Streptomyces sp. SID8352]|uniref:DUF4188 domain-containing protein n=1 Tax=Streptomyces sp. SID8352 TaxID=2690338 RepID=UPI00136C4CC1|nr:DUF4188 domain-containing protein [Streptomyces sp. SID8352]MYU21868.1 DUF4188 domain-containing protein [Streptomyces sp. SID8352]